MGPFDAASAGPEAACALVETSVARPDGRRRLSYGGRNRRSTTRVFGEEGGIEMGLRVRVMSIGLGLILAVALVACGPGSSESSGNPPLEEANREASFGADVELCIAAGPEMPGEEALVEFANQSFRWGDRLPLTSDRCATYRSFVVARIIDAEKGTFIMSISANGNPDENSPNLFLQCDQYTTTGGSFETRMDPFDRWSPPKTCFGKKVEAYRFADSRGTVEFNANIGF